MNVCTGVIDAKSHEVCIKRGAKFFAIGMSPRPISTKICILVSWSKPQDGLVKLETDGSSLGNPSKLGGSGLLRSSNGDWIKGIARYSGH